MSDNVSASAQGIYWDFEPHLDLDGWLHTTLLGLGSSEAGQSG